MSQDGPPSPLQSPLTTNAVGNMATVRRPPSFPIMDYNAHADRISFTGHSLPPIEVQTPRNQSYCGGGSTIELPPMQTSPSPRNPMKIAQLLSSPQPITIRSQPPMSPRDLPHSSPLSSRGSSIASVAPSRYSFAPMHLPPVDPTHPPFWNAQPHLHHKNRPTQQHPPFLHAPNTLDSADHMRYSPAMTAVSSTTSHLREPSYEPYMATAKPLNYTLSIRQQPVAARACGFGERDRRAIDPPPTVELKITDQSTGAPEQDPNVLFALHCTLQSPDGQNDETELSSPNPHVPSTRRLMGNLVASIWEGKDEHGIPGKFFVFPDMSCRSQGQYRLKFQLLRIDPTNMRPGQKSPAVASIVTDVFDVFTAKDFPGMRPSTALLKALKNSGLTVGVKKGSEARRRNAAKKGETSDEDDDDDGSEAEASPSLVDSGLVRFGSKHDLPATVHKRGSKRRRRRS
ncbi:Hypothetical protein R9X50_00560700 [Acrodontium crateriforme]|uniref:Velvet domain-containing protein n=1 Tax=Acrodontium crateriforme TaxID=150365 RepID=A0AAQ3M7E6_9PEZI|nr:Hypothetical protein R9X50_00560700 [Acrodontium crateriforme]